MSEMKCIKEIYGQFIGCLLFSFPFILESSSGCVSKQHILVQYCIHGRSFGELTYK